MLCCPITSKVKPYPFVVPILGNPDIAGAALARYGTDSVSRWSGLDDGFTGFLIGLFGMALVAKAFAASERVELAPIFVEWLRKFLGLPVAVVVAEAPKSVEPTRPPEGG